MSITLPAGSLLLASFRAGRLKREGTQVTPDTRKGLLRVVRTEDGLTHVEWSCRDAPDAPPEVETVVFPDEAQLVAPAKAPPRVYMLKFASEPDRDLMFWSQEPAADADAALVARFNRALNTPMGGTDAEMSEESAHELPGERMVPADTLLRDALSDAPGAGDVVTAGDSMGVLPSGPGQQPLAPAQLAALLSGMAGAGGGAGLGGGGGADPGASLAAALLTAIARRERQQEARDMAVAPGPSLAELLKPEVLAPLLADPEVLERLSAYLPPEQRSPASLRELAHSPQFHQQLATFSGALQTGQLDLAQFGLQAEGFTAADFLRAIQALVEREQAVAGGGGSEQA